MARAAWTRTDAYNLMNGRYRLHYKGPGSGGWLEAAGEFETLLEAQADAARWEAARPGMQVWIVRCGRFVVVDEELGEVR